MTLLQENSRGEKVEERKVDLANIARQDKFTGRESTEDKAEEPFRILPILRFCSIPDFTFSVNSYSRFVLSQERLLGVPIIYPSRLTIPLIDLTRRVYTNSKTRIDA